MSKLSPTNLTDRLSYLRERKKNSKLVEKQRPQKQKGPLAETAKKSVPERKFATDYFMLFVYSLLGIAMLSQFVLIAWLEIV